MHHYTVSRELYEAIAQTLGDRQQADKFVKTMEDFLSEIDERTHAMIQQHLHAIPLEIKDDLKHDLVTRELFEERMDRIDERFKHIDGRFKQVDERFNLQNAHIDERFAHQNAQIDERFAHQNTQIDERFTHLEVQFDEKIKGLGLRLNIFLAIALAALTFANPTFVKLLEKLLGI